MAGAMWRGLRLLGRVRRDLRLLMEALLLLFFLLILVLSLLVYPRLLFPMLLLLSVPFAVELITNGVRLRAHRRWHKMLSKLGPEDIAVRVVSGWTKANTGRIADRIGQEVSKFIPGGGLVGAWIIRPRLRKWVNWSYGKPSQVGAGQYQVTATATAQVNVGVRSFRRSFAVSGDFIIVVNTVEKRVADWQFDASSFQFKQGKSAQQATEG